MPTWPAASPSGWPDSVCPMCASYLALLESEHAGEAELDSAHRGPHHRGDLLFPPPGDVRRAPGRWSCPISWNKNWQSRQLRIWSAGCSTGAEAYSVAILLRGDLAAQIAGWDITIVGTDINREFLARAREGRFEDWAFRTTPEDMKRAYFSRRWANPGASPRSTGRGVLPVPQPGRPPLSLAAEQPVRLRPDPVPQRHDLLQPGNCPAAHRTIFTSAWSKAAGCWWVTPSPTWSCFAPSAR